ncbi:glycosyltransferase [uncultured Phascolarctobacterium sp.]|uniref:glycosyltransferase n=1 Tax=uncultured Phascolarctobacterium sp. TaxID=512296 RepID=UPI0025CF738F|nr:glycosyltransferase [uncultured Phascolarctobacterium sp.]
MKSCLFVVPSLADGGAERVVSVLSSELAKKIDKVSILIYWDTDFNYHVNDKVNIINLSGGNKKAYAKMSIASRLKKMRSVIKEEKPDVIIPFLPHVCLHVGIATLGLDCTVIQTVRNNPKSSPDSKIRRFIRDLQIRFSKCTIVQNEEQLEYFPEPWRKKIHILPNPINEDFLNIEYEGSEKFRAVAVGRLTEQKNFPLLINAFSSFAEKYINVSLSIYGDGALKDELNKLIKKNRMEKQIFLMGRTDNLPDILAHSSVFIMSSNFEGMPNSLMEAMAVGIPVISTDCPTGPKELIGDNERGLLVSIDNKELLIQAIQSILLRNSEALKRSYKAKGFITRNFSPWEISGQLIIICNNIK